MRLMQPKQRAEFTLGFSYFRGGSRAGKGELYKRNLGDFVGTRSRRAYTSALPGCAWSILVIWIVGRFPATLNQRQQPQKKETPKANAGHEAQDGQHHSRPNSMKKAAQPNAR
jgi:hypothetical protein